MFSLLAVEIPYWGQSVLRVLGGLVAVLLPAGTIVYVFLFKMIHIQHRHSFQKNQQYQRNLQSQSDR